MHVCPVGRYRYHIHLYEEPNAEPSLRRHDCSESEHVGRLGVCEDLRLFPVSRFVILGSILLAADLLVYSLGCNLACNRLLLLRARNHSRVTSFQGESQSVAGYFLSINFYPQQSAAQQALDSEKFLPVPGANSASSLEFSRTLAWVLPLMTSAIIIFRS